MRLALNTGGTLSLALILASTSLYGAEPKTAPEASSSLTADQAQVATRQHRHAEHGKTPKVEFFLGYSYLRAVPTYAAGNRLVHMNGGSASIAFNLNRYLGIVGDFGGFADSRINLTGPGVATPHISDSGGQAYTYLAGPRLSFRGQRFTPFAQVLAGSIHATPVVIDHEICSGSPSCTPLPSQNAFGMTAGAGLDITLTRHLALRAVQAEYLMTRFSDPTTQAKNTQNDIRLSSGLLLRFGGAPPLPPLAYSCSVSPASGYPGDPMTVTGSAINANPKHPVTYTWTADGGTITGTTETATIDTRNTPAGSYAVHGHVSQSSRSGDVADCSASYSVLAYQPPTVACAADPSSLSSGDTARITANAQSPQNRPLTYSYSASAGSISGTTSSATLGTAGTNPGVITITCNVTDDKGQSASAMATVMIQTPPPVAVIETRKLCAVDFVRDQKRPTRVNNEAKACLDDIALNLQRSTDAKLALVGHSDHDAVVDAAELRAVHTKEYLVTDKGIDPGRIAIYTGTSGSRSVDTILIPSGASLDTTGLTLAAGHSK